jgi:hypothetical protein
MMVSLGRQGLRCRLDNSEVGGTNNGERDQILCKRVGNNNTVGEGEVVQTTVTLGWHGQRRQGSGGAYATVITMKYRRCGEVW